MTALKPQERAVEIRPGVFRPDWSAVTKPGARRALIGRMNARAGLLDRWSHVLDADEDLVWRSLMQHYASRGQPPLIDDIAKETGIAGDRLAAALRRLESRDLIGLDPASAQIRLAYPFTEAATGHRVEFNGRTLNALCAIDSLGVAAMYGIDATISSLCRRCGEAIRVTTMVEGWAFESVTPPGAVVWYDFAYDGCAAASSCPSTAFFCCDDHLRQWQEFQTPRRDGARLAMDEALELGRAIFGPVLAEPSRTP
jgi:alkylmercury lyase